MPRVKSCGEYPPDWPEISAQVKAEAGNRCERCGHIHDPASGHTLTVHHLDGNKSNCWRMRVKKPKAKRFTCGAYWIIRPEKWPGRGWRSAHQIGRCQFWNPKAGNHRTEHGRCMKYPGLICPYKGWRDFTELQQEVIRKRNRNYQVTFEDDEAVLV